MKKRYLMMTAGLMLSLGLMTGCGAKTTEAETVTETEASSAEESISEEETVADSSEEDEEGERQIVAVSKMLGNEFGMKVTHFTANESAEEREVIKRRFSTADPYQAIVAIKCLDEGVNIPSIKTAFILASTTNPKEYIQRRGRVLRLADGKEYAEIYDFITLPRPLDEVSSLTEEEMQRELTLVKNELCRAEEFARIAMNGVSCSAILDNIREAYDLQDYVLDFEEDFNYGD